MTRPKRPDHALRLDFRVYLHHCDLLGVAWYGRYFEWIEMARSELFASRDLDIPAVREMGYRMHVVDARCRNMAPLQCGDDVTITAWFSQTTPLIRVAYDFTNQRTGRWSARASTTLATTDASRRLLDATPRPVLERLPQVAPAAEDHESP